MHNIGQGDPALSVGKEVSISFPRNIALEFQSKIMISFENPCSFIGIGDRGALDEKEIKGITIFPGFVFQKYSRQCPPQVSDRDECKIIFNPTRFKIPSEISTYYRHF